MHSHAQSWISLDNGLHAAFRNGLYFCCCVSYKTCWARMGMCAKETRQSRRTRALMKVRPLPPGEVPEVDDDDDNDDISN